MWPSDLSRENDNCDTPKTRRFFCCLCECFKSLKFLMKSQWKEHGAALWKKHGATLKKYNKILLYFTFNFVLSAWDNSTDIWAAICHFK